MADSMRPDVVLMDLAMPALDGIAATKAIRATAPGVHVVILTSFFDPARVLSALDAGASGYLLKESDPDELYRAIRAAARGESPLSPKAASALIAARAARSRGNATCPRVSATSSRWWRKATPTRRSRAGWASRRRRSRAT